MYSNFVSLGGNNLLIKSVASSELLLPTNSPEKGVGGENLPEKAISEVRAVLTHLPVLDEYDPLQHPSGLYNVLSKCLKNNPPAVSI